MKLCIYGGTFSPPHRGHLFAVEKYLCAADAGKVLIMPSNIPPHKEIEYEVPAAHRLEMAKIAFSSLDSFGEKIFVSDYEIKSGGKSYTAKTLKHFSRKYKDIDLLVGSDMFLSLHTWKKPEVITSKARIVLCRREKDPEYTKKIEEQKENLIKNYGARIFILENTGDPVEVSSTEIREMISAGKRPDEITKETFEYILENNLYHSKESR